MNRIVPLATVLLVVLAGCTGAPADTTTEPTATVEATPTQTPSPTESSTPTPSATESTTSTVTIDDAFAPGVDATGVTNLTALLLSHRDTLSDHGFELVINRTLSAADARNGTVSRRTLAEAALRQYRRTTDARIDGQRYETQQWATATRILSRSSAQADPVYDSRDLPAWSPDAREWRAGGITQLSAVRSLVAGGNYTLQNVTRDGDRTLATYVAEVTVESDRADYGDRHVRLVVTDGGYVHALSVTGTFQDRDGTFAYEYRVADLGIQDVSAPGWVADAPTPVEATVDIGFVECNRTALTIEHVDGDGVPAGADVALTAGNVTYRGTLETALAAGDTRYLVVENDTVQVQADRPSSGERQSLPTELSFTVTTAEGYQVENGAIGIACERAGDDVTTASA